MRQHLKAPPVSHSMQHTTVFACLSSKAIQVYRAHLLTCVLLVAGLSYYTSNYQDPNISHQGGEDDSEAEDFQVQASDFVILAARNEDEVSHIEVSSFSLQARRSGITSSASTHVAA